MTLGHARSLDAVVRDFCRAVRQLAGDFTEEPPAVAEHAVGSGELLDRVLAGGLPVPWLHELALFARPEGFPDVFDRALSAARTRPRRLDPLVRAARAVLDLHPPGIDGPVAAVRDAVAAYGEAKGLPRLPERYPDVRGRFGFAFWSDLDGGRFRTIREAWGRLGCPGVVYDERDEYAQRKLSGGTGDHAGHLIGSQFGAPGSGENLALQNAVQNAGGGTWYGLEEQWADALRAGVGIEAHVRVYYAPGTARPAYRDAAFTLYHPDLRVERVGGGVAHLNTHTPDREKKTKPGEFIPGSRTRQSVPATTDGSQPAAVIPITRGRRPRER
jgi:hypothetical protein